MRRRERHDYPRWKETTLPRRLSLPQISRLLKRNERRPIFLFSNGSPSSRPPRTLCPYTRDGSLPPWTTHHESFLSLITRHREICVSGGRFLSLDLSWHNFRGPRFVRDSTLTTTPLGLGFLEEKREIEATLLSLSLHPLCPLPEKRGNRLKRWLSAPFLPSFFFLFFSSSPSKLSTQVSRRTKVRRKLDATNDSLLKGFLPLSLLHLLN